MNITITDVQAFAAQIGITPETCSHLVMSYDHPDFPEGGIVGEVLDLPDPLGPDADPVFAVPLLEYLNEYEHWVGWGKVGGKEPKVYEAGIWYADDADAALGRGNTITAAILHAACAAGVEFDGLVVEQPKPAMHGHVDETDGRYLLRKNTEYTNGESRED